MKSNKVKISIVFLAIVLGLIQISIFDIHGNFSKDFWLITVPDVNFLQKILLCFLMISFLDNYEESNITVLKKTAETSFAIYFIHPFLLNPITKSIRSLGLEIPGNIFTLIGATFIVMGVSMIIARLLKLILKGKSRYIIGW